MKTNKSLSEYNKRVIIFGKIAILFLVFVVYPIVGYFVDIQFMFFILSIGILLASGAFWLCSHFPDDTTPKLDLWLSRIFLGVGSFLFVSSLITVKGEKEIVNNEFSITPVVNPDSKVVENSRGIGASTKWFTTYPNLENLNLVRFERKGLYSDVYFLRFEYEGKRVSMEKFYQINNEN